MIERQFITAKKRELMIKEFVKRELGKGKVSGVGLERTPLGERIIVHTSKPGLIIGRRGESIQELTNLLKQKFKLENPQIEIAEIKRQEHDAQFMADYIASSLERFGQLRFKSIAYKALQRIIDSDALGAELRLSGKLPSERAKSWRFAYGYLKKTGQPAELIVNKAYASAHTKPGVIGVKVSIVPPDADIIEIKERKIIEEQVPESAEDKENLLAVEVKEEVKEEKKKAKKVVERKSGEGKKVTEGEKHGKKKAEKREKSAESKEGTVAK